jgi:phospholipase C
MESRRAFIKKSLLLSGAAGLSAIMPASIQRALAIDPKLGSTFLDAEHIVILMQENRSFDHCFGTLQGVRGFNDPRAIRLPNQKPVWMQTNAIGDTYAPFRLNIKDSKVTWMGSLPHSRASQVDAYNEGKYDGWLTAKQSGNKKYSGMPLTLGHYTREDLPFNYSMADAFTVCDQNFCSAMTSTTPNRSFFWTGKISYDLDGLQKVNIRNDDFSYGKLPWTAFPELLEANQIPWKFYQNDLSCGGGYKGEERAWLGNFGCNLLEFFAAYQVKFSSRYVKNLQKLTETLPDEINKLQEASPSSEAAAKKIQADLKNKMAALDNASEELKRWSKEAYAKLSEEQKSLFKRAFVINSGDPDYRSITTLTYMEGQEERKVTVPKGDILHQFREDVNTGQLPAVSWLAGPQNFSDHPSAPWYGAWYVSEVLDILTKNPEVWKKTIFITTYDENDGYFDHVPPFSIPDAKIPGTGLVSAGIDTEVEHVRLANELKQGVPEKAAREAPIGLGFRVPMLVASPWSRGGKVCSEVFDHTSSLQFLEMFFNRKLNKKLHIENISEWRRTICGDLSSVFSPYEGEKIKSIDFLKRNQVVEDIYNAKFKSEPSGFKLVSEADVKAFTEDPGSINIIPKQEQGIRPACALPYELYVDGGLNKQKKQFELRLTAGDTLFGKSAAGAPFTVVAPGSYEDAATKKTETCRNWSFAVKSGDTLGYSWLTKDFKDGAYHLEVNGPNGYFRSYRGNEQDPDLVISCGYEGVIPDRKPTGNVLLKIKNSHPSASYQVVLYDEAYGLAPKNIVIKPASTEYLLVATGKSYGWYDCSLQVRGVEAYQQRFAGRVETGKESFTDPFMGRVV